MKNHFIIPYAGNKREEVEIIYETIKHYIEDKKIIIEPFCGSSAISCYISLQEPKKYKYILNDMDKHLIQLYKIMQDDDKLKKFLEEVNDICFDKDNNFIDKETYLNYLKKDNVYSWFIGRKYYKIRPKMYPSDGRAKLLDFEKINEIKIINFLRTEDIEFLNKEAIDVMEEYKNNKKVFIILDPPYINTCNAFYTVSNNSKLNIYEYMCNNHVINKKNICFILEKTWIVNMLFKQYKKIEYDKNYNGLTRKKVKHMIFIND